MIVNNRQFEPTPPLFGAPVGVTRWNFAEIFGVRNLDPFSYGVVCVILRLAVQCRMVTDRQIDGQTDRRTDRHTMTAYTALA